MVQYQVTKLVPGTRSLWSTGTVVYVTQLYLHTFYWKRRKVTKMANVTDPLARAIHGTNPQNLIEYITRQRIYDSQYWKEDCFGLCAQDVAEKSVKQLKAIGGSYGGNNKPTRFLCLTLKMLQIQPESGIIDELIQNEDFKYVRALGAFYLRLTGRPAEIYEKLEPLYNDYRKLRFRNPTGWDLIHMDEFVNQLLTDDRVCGIALPRLPKRDMLVEAGYLDGNRVSAVLPHDSDDDEEEDDDDDLQRHQKRVRKVENILLQMAQDGCQAAKVALDERSQKVLNAKLKSSEGEADMTGTTSSIQSKSFQKSIPEYNENNYSSRRENNDEYDFKQSTKRPRMNDQDEIIHDHIKNSSRNHRENGEVSSPLNRNTNKSEKNKKYGSLFKTSDKSHGKAKDLTKGNDSTNDQSDKFGENTVEYWNDQRAKLGLKPLKE